VSKILLIRHGHIEGIRPPRFRGRADLPLIPRGIAEANAVARRIAFHWRPVQEQTFSWLQLPHPTSSQERREDFAYFNDDGVLVAYRLGD